MCPEIDGVRIINWKQNQIIRKLQESYIKIFKRLSTEVSALLYESYLAFEERNPLENEDLRNLKSELAEGVLDCINAGTFEVNEVY